jgi:hypothetical protein
MLEAWTRMSVKYILPDQCDLRLCFAYFLFILLSAVSLDYNKDNKGLSMKVVTLFLLTTCLLAGEQGILRGKVVDQITKESIPGATVLVDSARYGTCTDANGEFEIRLPAGIHAIIYAMIGYHKLTVNDMVIKADSVVTQNVALVIQPLSLSHDELVFKVPGDSWQKNDQPSAYKLKIIKPDGSIDYKIIQVVPDSTIDYKIIIMGAE